MELRLFFPFQTSNSFYGGSKIHSMEHRADHKRLVFKLADFGCLQENFYPNNPALLGPVDARKIHLTFLRLYSYNKILLLLKVHGFKRGISRLSHFDITVQIV